MKRNKKTVHFCIRIIYKRSFLNQNKITFPDSSQNEDNGFNQLCILHDPKICYLNEITYVWKYNENSVVRKNNEEFQFTGLKGYCENMVWSLKEAQLHSCDIHIIAARVFSNYIFLY